MFEIFEILKDIFRTTGKQLGHYYNSNSFRMFVEEFTGPMFFPEKEIESGSATPVDLPDTDEISND